MLLSRLVIDMHLSNRRWLGTKSGRRDERRRCRKLFMIAVLLMVGLCHRPCLGEPDPLAGILPLSPMSENITFFYGPAFDFLFIGFPTRVLSTP